ncbi:MAG: hypothetical protein JXR64_10465 [Spirochaetales bacterium]|nr:hypothetical protein [Spirochaetales bacterium]
MVLVRQAYKLFLFLFLFSCATENSNVNRILKSKEIKHRIEKKYSPQEDKTLIPGNQSDNLSDNILSEGTVSCLMLSNDDLWIGMLGGAIYRYNVFTNEIKKFLDEKYTIVDYSIKKIVDTDEFIYALQSNKIIKINKKKETIEEIYFPDNLYRSSDMVLGDKKIYLSTLGFGLWEVDLNNNNFIQIESNIEFISSLLFKDQQLYIGSMDNGLYILNIPKNKIESRLKYPLKLFRKNILSIIIIDDMLILGTQKNGILKWNFKDNILTNTYEKDYVSSISKTSEDYFIASLMGKGILINFINNDEKLLTIDNSLVTNNITSVILFNNLLIYGTIKKGIQVQELQKL